MSDLTYEQVSNFLRYEPETGKLYWLARHPNSECEGIYSEKRKCAAWNARYAGKEAFTAVGKTGYLYGSIHDKLYRAHRIVWLLCHKEWPADQLDHINGDRADNRIENLRQVSNAENCKNRARPSNNSSGEIGVYWHARTKRWNAKVHIDGKAIHLGNFEKYEDAVARRQAASADYGFHANHGRPMEGSANAK